MACYRFKRNAFDAQVIKSSALKTRYRIFPIWSRTVKVGSLELWSRFILKVQLLKSNKSQTLGVDAVEDVGKSVVSVSVERSAVEDVVKSVVSVSVEGSVVDSVVRASVEDPIGASSVEVVIAAVVVPANSIT